MLNIYYGRENTDKEKFIFDNIEGRTLLLVPDQFSLQAERDAFFYLDKKSLIDLRVVDFSTLGHKVVNEVGGRKPELIDKYGRHMLLTKIIGEAEEELHIYKGMNWKNSFVDMMNSLISEMKRYEVSPKQIEDVLGELDENSYLKLKLADIKMIYSKYQDYINGKYLDSEDYITFYGEKILNAPMVKEAEVWIYGFDTFTPKNLQVIERILKTARSVNIVMTYEADNEIFELTRYVIGQLRKLAEDLNEQVSVNEIQGQARKTVWDSEDGKYPVTMVQTSDVYAEAERAAAYILHLVREEGYRFGDIVVVCNDMDLRGGVLRRTFMRWGIPVFMDRKRKVTHHSAVKFLLALMEAISAGYRSDAVMRLIKSGIAGIGTDDAELLENYVKHFKIRGGMWKKDFSKTAGKYVAEQLNNINAMRKHITGIIETARECIGTRNTAAEKIKGLYEFLQKDFGIKARLEKIIEAQQTAGFSESAAETAQSWNVICNILDQMVEVAGDEKLSNEELLKLMTAGLEEVEIGLVPASTDCVQIGTLQRTRASRKKVLVAVGANYGILPLETSEEGLLSDREKQKLETDYRLEIAKGNEIVRQEETLAVYRTLCLPEERLYISCCRSDESGEELRPSEIFTGVQEFLAGRGQTGVLFDLQDSENFYDMISSQKGTLSYMAQALRDVCDGGDINAEWLNVMNWYEENQPDEFNKVKNGMFFDNRINAVGAEFAGALYAGEREHLEVSASRLEKYSNCPFAHFIMYGLRAEDMQVYEMGAREIGDIYHRCLMALSKKLTPAEDSGIKVTSQQSAWMTITEQECREEVRNIINQDAQYFYEGLLMSGKAEEYRTERIADICSTVAWSMIQQVRKGSISRMYFEQPFGRGRMLPAVEVDAGEKKVLIRGVIDRLDILEADKPADGENGSEGGHQTAVRIVDYKTGGDFVDVDHIRSGYKLQLMVYMDAAMKGDFDGTSAEAEPAGVFYFKIHELDTKADVKKAEFVIEELGERAEKEYRLEGIVLNDPDLIRAMDGSDIGEKETFKVVPVKLQNGEYKAASGGHLLTPEEFNDLYEQVNAHVKRICTEICEGRIDIRPKRERKADMTGTRRNACRYCAYKSICMFDTAFEGCTYEQV